MTKGIFITATDTGVGKTIVSAMIIRAMVVRGIKVAAMKPFETGCQRQGDELVPSDGLFLRDMAGMDDSIDIVTPVRFELPLAPIIASKLEKKPVDLEKFLRAYEYIRNKYNFMVIEGVGGIYVPVAYGIGEPHFEKLSVIYVSDIIKRLNLPVIIVSRPTLGTINHTLLTVEHALNKGLKVLGIIINYNNPPGADISEETNPHIIAELSPVPVLGMLPHCTNFNKDGLDNVVCGECKQIFDEIASRILA
jgi:dethiobiotin synthetase